MLPPPTSCNTPFPGAGMGCSRVTPSILGLQQSGPAVEGMNWEGLGLGGRGSKAFEEEQFDDLVPDWERSNGCWYEELLISGLEWWAPWGISASRQSWGVEKCRQVSVAREQRP